MVNLHCKLKQITNMKDQIEINEGEIKLTINEKHEGKLYLSDLGLKPSDMELESGLLRFVIEIKNAAELKLYAMPTIEFSYTEDMGETHWQSEFNGEVISDKNDHHGHSTVILLNRKKLEALLHRHDNKLVIHAEFPKPAIIDTSKSYLNLFH